MPNYCSNNLDIQTSKVEEVKNILLNNDGELDFSILVPEPEGEYDYDFCVKNWGTKWNVINQCGNGLHFNFETARSPPDIYYNTLYEKLQEIDPEATIYAQFYEPGMQFYGTYADGILYVNDIEGCYYSEYLDNYIVRDDIDPDLLEWLGYTISIEEGLNKLNEAKKEIEDSTLLKESKQSELELIKLDIESISNGI